MLGPKGRVLLWSGQLLRQKATGAVDRFTFGGHARRQGWLFNLGDTKHNFTGYGLPLLVTRSTGEG
jgi:hypothetical protein